MLSIPYKGTDADLERPRENFHDKIIAILVSAHRENAVAGTLTLAEFISHGGNQGGRPDEEGRHVKGLSEKERLRKKKVQASNEHAYTLEEVADVLDKLPEPARTVCAVAAFTGVAKSELKGLKWEDYDGETINVRRKIWNDHVEHPRPRLGRLASTSFPYSARFWQSAKRGIRL